MQKSNTWMKKKECVPVDWFSNPSGLSLSARRNYRWCGCYLTCCGCTLAEAPRRRRPLRVAAGARLPSAPSCFVVLPVSPSRLPQWLISRPSATAPAGNPLSNSTWPKHRPCFSIQMDSVLFSVTSARSKSEILSSHVPVEGNIKKVNPPVGGGFPEENNHLARIATSQQQYLLYCRKRLGAQVAEESGASSWQTRDGKRLVQKLKF